MTISNYKQKNKTKKRVRQMVCNDSVITKECGMQE